jgi:hypothetical protein
MSRSPSRTWPLLAAAVIGGTTGLYLWIVGNQTNDDPWRVGLVAVLLLSALAGAIGGALLPTAAGRHLAAAVATGLLLSLGVLAIFSIGSFLLVAAGLLIVGIGAGRTPERHTPPLLVIGAFVVGAGLPWVLVLTA